ncbi:MAG TPA: tetratricopeptide repeat protein [Allosphingosinicella sp.]|nr:tetratricopeptide repeat protein [Allosphingosinicella sp.]
MAIKPRDNETFYREVDEELRRDHLATLVRRYGWAFALGIVLLLAAIAGVIYWRHLQEVRAGERGERLTALFQDIQAGKAKEAGPKLEELAREGSPGYRAAALLTKADVAVQSGDDAAAAAAFKAVVEDEGLARPYRDLALIRQTAVEFDRLPPATVVERLAPLARAGNPWFGSAGEMVALAHLKQGKPALAAPIFAAIAKDETLPQSMRSRAMQMAGALGVDAVQPSESTGEAPAAKEATE